MRTQRGEKNTKKAHFHNSFTTNIHAVAPVSYVSTLQYQETNQLHTLKYLTLFVLFLFVSTDDVNCDAHFDH